MDCDFSHDPAALPALIGAVGDGRPGAGLALRAAAAASPAGGRCAGPSAAAGACTPSSCSACGVRDLTGGFKCFRREVLEAIPLDEVTAAGYGFQIEMTYRAHGRSGSASSRSRSPSPSARHGSSKMSRGIVWEAAALVPRLRRLGRPPRRTAVEPLASASPRARRPPPPSRPGSPPPGPAGRGGAPARQAAAAVRSGPRKMASARHASGLSGCSRVAALVGAERPRQVAEVRVGLAEQQQGRQVDSGLAARASRARSTASAAPARRPARRRPRGRPGADHHGSDGAQHGHGDQRAERPRGEGAGTARAVGRRRAPRPPARRRPRRAPGPSARGWPTTSRRPPGGRRRRARRGAARSRVRGARSAARSAPATTATIRAASSASPMAPVPERVRSDDVVRLAGVERVVAVARAPSGGRAGSRPRPAEHGRRLEARARPPPTSPGAGCPRR